MSKIMLIILVMCCSACAINKNDMQVKLDNTSEVPINNDFIKNKLTEMQKGNKP